MATANPFDLLGDFDNDDPSQLIAAQQPKMEQKKALAPTQSPAQQPAARLPSKPLPPSQAVREAKTEAGRGGRGGGRGYGRGRGRGSGFNRDLASNENSFGNSGFPGGQGATEETDIGKPYERRGGYGGPRGSFRGGRRGGFSNGEAAEGERPRRPFERRSGTGWGNEIKREGSGRGNWGTPADELAQVTEEVINEVEKNQDAEKPSGEDTMDSSKENPVNEVEEKEPEDKTIVPLSNNPPPLVVTVNGSEITKADSSINSQKDLTSHVSRLLASYRATQEMTLEEYEKVLEEKRKALLALRTEERKVDFDKEFASMQQLSNKKVNDDIFIKLGSDKDKRKEYAEKEEKTKKSVSINEFLKPAEGERYYTGRGRGRGRGPRGGYTGGGPMNNISAESAPKIEDPGQFPTLGAK